jgi:polar amino acid transport system substrate-binding protein/arginine/ornithine transport system substrate-binding protein
LTSAAGRLKARREKTIFREHVMTRILRAGVCAAALLAAGPALALNICVEGAYPPFSETAPDGSIVGFDIDIANALCAEMGETCEMVKVDWDGIIPALLEKKCDAIIASMSITEERKQVIDFSEKYYHTGAAVIAAEGAVSAPTAEGLAGKVIGVQRGTMHQAYAEGELPDAQLQLYASQDEAYLDLVAGRIDAVIGDVIAMTDGFLETDEGKGFVRVGDTFYNPKYHGVGAGIGVRKEDTELRDRFSAAIQAIRASGQYDEIQKKYFDFDVYGAATS